MYLAPLIYITNQESIDEQLGHAGRLINDQTAQIREVAGQHTAKATESIKGYSGEYMAKAQEMIGGRSGGKLNGVKKEAPPAYQASDFPSAPTEAPAPEAPVKSEPLAA